MTDLSNVQEATYQKEIHKNCVPKTRVQSLLTDQARQIVDEIPDQAEYRITHNALWQSGHQLKDQLRSKYIK